MRRAIFRHEDGIEEAVACKFLYLEQQQGIYNDIIKEAMTIAMFNHKNILNLVGVSFKDNLPVIITTYMAEGSLLKYLQSKQQVLFQNFLRWKFSITLQSLTMLILLNFCVDIAEGMRYIHSCGFMHRDLAARNCL